MKYYHYEIKFRYKLLPDGKKNTEYVWFGLKGRTLNEAIEHSEFWAESDLEKASNMEFISIETCGPYEYEERCMYPLENAVKFALANKEQAEEIVSKSDLDNYDKAELIADIRSGEPWMFHMDTWLRERFCELMGY